MKTTKNLIFISVVTMAFIIFCIQAVYNIYTQQKESFLLKETLLINSAVKEAKTFDYLIGEVSQSARVLALLIGNDEKLQPIIYDEFIRDNISKETIAFGMGYWFEPYYVDKDIKYYGPYIYKDYDDQLVRTIEYSNEMYDYLNQDWYRNSFQSDKLVVYSTPFYDEYLDTVFLTAAVKIINNGQQVGVVSIDITSREVDEYLRKMSEKNNATTFILTEDGYFWGEGGGVEFDFQDNIMKSGNDEYIKLATALKKSDNAGAVRLDRHIFVWSNIGDTGLRLTMGYPIANIMYPIYKRSFLYFIYFLFAMIIFIFLLNVILVRRIERPLVNIINQNLSEDPNATINIKLFRNKISDFDSMIQLIQGLLSERQQHIYELQKGYIVTVRSLSNAIEAKDKYTKGHCENVTKFSIETAKILGVPNEDLNVLEYAALLHDVGKIGVPSSILNKPSMLTDKEFDIIRSHPMIGYEILKDIDFLKRSALIVLQHHERFDGKGYPRGIEKDELDLLTRIITVTDAYDAMTSARPYRTNPLSHEEAIKILAECSGTQFDPQVVDAFIRVMNKNIR